MEHKVNGQRYTDTDWEFHWEGLLEHNPELKRKQHFFRVISHPMKHHEDWGGATWGNSGVYTRRGNPIGISGCDDARERREAIAAKCWDIIDNEPGITLEMMQEELRKIDLELVRTARIALEKPDVNTH